MKKEYENLIYHNICEQLIDKYKKTKFTTFKNLCRHIKMCLEKNLPLSKRIETVLLEIADSICYRYNETKENMIELIRIFFLKEKWKVYHDYIITLRFSLNNEFI